MRKSNEYGKQERKLLSKEKAALNALEDERTDKVMDLFTEYLINGRVIRVKFKDSIAQKDVENFSNYEEKVKALNRQYESIEQDKRKYFEEKRKSLSLKRDRLKKQWLMKLEKDYQYNREEQNKIGGEV